MRQENHEYAAMVASVMDGWKYDSKGSRCADGELMPCARLAGPGGLSLLVSFDDNKKRISVSASWPKDDGRYMSARDYGAIEYGESEPRISASMKRPAEAVARDITRRLLPDVEAIWQKIQDRIADNAAYRAAVADRGAALSEGLDFVKENQQDQSRYKGDYNLGGLNDLGWSGDMQVMAEDVHINLRWLTVQQARSVLEALKQ